MKVLGSNYFVMIFINVFDSHHYFMFFSGGEIKTFPGVLFQWNIWEVDYWIQIIRCPKEVLVQRRKKTTMEFPEYVSPLTP